jgi:hypothetical protein
MTRKVSGVDTHVHVSDHMQYANVYEWLLEGDGRATDRKGVVAVNLP